MPASKSSVPRVEGIVCHSIHENCECVGVAEFASACLDWFVDCVHRLRKMYCRSIDITNFGDFVAPRLFNLGHNDSLELS